VAKRRDERAIPIVTRELRNGTEWPHYVEAAEILADPRLYETLATVAKTGQPPADLSAALAACDPHR
jgi:hypothetical protein